MEEYDIVICGAGPAGCMLASVLGHTRRILMVESRDCSVPCGSGYEKNCGGMLNLDAQKTLASFGMALPSSILVSPQVYTVRAIDYDSGMERYYQKQYINLDRDRLERWLLQKARASETVTFRDRTCVTAYDAGADQVRVMLRDLRTGKETSVQTRYLIGADGASSLIRRHEEARQGVSGQPRGLYRRYISIQEWFPMKEPLAYYAALFSRDVTDFYSWIIPKEDRMILGAAIPAAPGAWERFDILKRKAASSGFPTEESPLRKAGCQLIRPYGPGSVWLGAHRVLLAGEAAGLISASSEEGISYALRSGEALGKALLACCDPEEVMDQYARRMLPMKYGLLKKSLKGAVMYQPLLRALIFRSALLSMKTERLQ